MYEYRAKVVSVYDGDTIRVDIDLGFGVSLNNQTVRLGGINSPEMRGEERTEGLKAREALREQIDGQEVTIRTAKDRKGKYGRWLAVVDRKGVNINEWMIDHGYAMEYS